MPFNSITEVESYLEKIPKFQSDGKAAANFDLERFRNFCRDIGNPQFSLNCIHVAGTNGKGSTCRLLASVYQIAGYNVGLFTSPHLMEFAERFVIDGAQITAEELVSFFNENEQLIHQHTLTYFEISTAIAFWWFTQKNVDLAIIEVGLGGRLDATNIITPLVSVITSISLDHTDVLGTSIKDIAREKAGIIKKNVPVVVGNINGVAERVITETSKKMDAALHRSNNLRPSFKSGTHYISVSGETIEFNSRFLAPVQAHNIAAAWQVTEVLKSQFPISKQELTQGVNRSSVLYPNRGRFEKLLDSYNWYFDGGHNLEAIQAIKAMVKTIKPVSESVLVLSMMKDKLSPEVIKEFSEFKKIYYYTLESNRAASVDLISQYVPDFYAFPASEELQKGFFEEFESELVIFAGSFYFYPTVQKWLSKITTGR